MSTDDEIRMLTKANESLERILDSVRGDIYGQATSEDEALVREHISKNSVRIQEIRDGTMLLHVTDLTVTRDALVASCASENLTSDKLLVITGLIHQINQELNRRNQY